MPVNLDDFRAYDVPGIVGILKKNSDGSFDVIDAFESESIPSAKELAYDERFGSWVVAAGGVDGLRFDVFLMPKADVQRRAEVVTLLERSCGFRTLQLQAYAHAV